MDSSGADQRLWDSPRGDPAGLAHRVQMVLELTEATHRRSAALLRACGQEDRARRAEQFAAWARFDLDEPRVARQLFGAAARLRSIGRLERLAEQALHDVLSLARAERGNVQLVDPASGALTIVAQQGFDAQFLDYFAVVADDRTACGRAARHAAQLIITDVICDPGFEPHRAIAAASGFRAVQSTPLVDPAGRVVGVVSTHYPRPYAPPTRDMRIIKRYASLIGQVLAPKVAAAPPVTPGAGLPSR